MYPAYYTVHITKHHLQPYQVNTARTHTSYKVKKIANRALHMMPVGTLL